MSRVNVLVMGFILLASHVWASDIDVSNLDKELRSSTSKSIMFRQRGGDDSEQEMREQTEAEARNAAEQQREAQLKKNNSLFRPYNLFGNGLKIVATINGEMISNKDLQERANLFSLTTGINVNDKNKKMVSDKVLQNTIDEKIKLQEAEKQGIYVSDKEVNEAYRNFEKSNGVPFGKFATVLKEYQVSKGVFLNQIKANLVWNKLISKKQGGDVSEREIEAEFERIKKDMDTPKYMVSEIVIKRKDADHIEELVEILRNDPRFELYAAQFSQAPSAPSGGKIGWVAPGQLAEPLDKVIRNLKEGQVSQAILYRTDYYIYKMNKIYDPLKNKQKMPTEDEVRKFIQERKSGELANKYIRDLRNRAVVEKKF